MCISCRSRVDVHKGEGGLAVWHMWTHVDRGRGVRNLIFCGRYKWISPRAIRGARDFIDEPGYLPEDLKALCLCYHRPTVICATLNPCSTSDELTGMVAKMRFAMFSLVVLN